MPIAFIITHPAMLRARPSLRKRKESEGNFTVNTVVAIHFILLSLSQKPASLWLQYLIRRLQGLHY